jgi:hypothetical protein
MSGPDNQIEQVMKDCHGGFHKQDRTVPRPRTALTRQQVIEAARQRGRALMAKSAKRKP